MKIGDKNMISTLIKLYILHMYIISHEVKRGEGKEQYRVEISNRFAALEDLDAEMEINSAWEMIREKIKISAKECLR
jgi:hypothetical protein